MTKQEVINQINSVIRDKTEPNSITPEMLSDVLTSILEYKEDIFNVDFSGEVDLTHGVNLYYNDYTQGNEVNLTTQTPVEPGSTATVRIQGDLLGTIPDTWNLSGDSISRDLSVLNELTFLAVSDNDIRVVNRVI